MIGQSCLSTLIAQRLLHISNHLQNFRKHRMICFLKFCSKVKKMFNDKSCSQHYSFKVNSQCLHPTHTPHTEKTCEPPDCFFKRKWLWKLPEARSWQELQFLVPRQSGVQGLSNQRQGDISKRLIARAHFPAKQFYLWGFQFSLFLKWVIFKDILIKTVTGSPNAPHC